jgi:hypothetical protein
MFYIVRTWTEGERERESRGTSGLVEEAVVVSTVWWQVGDEVAMVLGHRGGRWRGWSGKSATRWRWCWGNVVVGEEDEVTRESMTAAEWNLQVKREHFGYNNHWIVCPGVPLAFYCCVVRRRVNYQWTVGAPLIRARRAEELVLWLVGDHTTNISMRM